MKKIYNYFRLEKLIYEVIKTLNIDLSTMTVLTEIASGNFIVTPIIATMANAKKVYVVCRDSSYGKRDEIIDYIREISDVLQIAPNKICYVEDKNEVAKEINIVTNLGFVRPIDAAFIQKLPYDAAIPLMFESWEFRKEDIDIRACIQKKIPILGTRETESHLRIFRYVGMSVLKLLLEMEIEVFKSKILLISSGEYLKETKQVLENNGAKVKCYDSFQCDIPQSELIDFLQHCDAVVVAEQKSEECLIGENTNHIDVRWLLKSRPCIIHIAGVMDYDIIAKYEILKYPVKPVDYGYMTVTTDYVGIRPVIELHAAGLKVGQALVEGMRKYHDVMRAKEYALNNSPAMDFDIG